jgi:hypothetical protein
MAWRSVRAHLAVVTDEDPESKVPEIPVDIAEEPREGTQHSGFISPVFGDVGAKMKQRGPAASGNRR